VAFPDVVQCFRVVNSSEKSGRLNILWEFVPFNQRLVAASPLCRARPATAMQLMDTSDGWLNVSENNQRIKPLN